VETAAYFVVAEALANAGKYANAVKESVARIQKLNISGTPMFLVGRTPAPSQPMIVAKVIEGAQPFEVFVQHHVRAVGVPQPRRLLEEHAQGYRPGPPAEQGGRAGRSRSTVSLTS